MKKSFSLFFLFFQLAMAQAQKDTIYLDAGNIRTHVLKPATNHYLVYFKNGKDSSRIRYQLWTRKTDTAHFNGQQAITITQVWEDNDTVFHKVFSVCDAQTFAPLYQDAWWRLYGNFRFDFVKRTAEVMNQPLIKEDTVAFRKKMRAAFDKANSEPVYNWHLDLEVFSMLPFRDHTTFGINFYDPGQAEPQVQFYTVSGSGKLTDYSGRTMDCWLLTHGKEGNKETFWINKKTKEILKLEQEVNGRFRYKIKLPFAS